VIHCRTVPVTMARAIRRPSGSSAASERALQPQPKPPPLPGSPMKPPASTLDAGPQGRQPPLHLRSVPRPRRCGSMSGAEERVPRSLLGPPFLRPQIRRSRPAPPDVRFVGWLSGASGRGQRRRPRRRPREVPLEADWPPLEDDRGGRDRAPCQPPRLPAVQPRKAGAPVARRLVVPRLVVLRRVDRPPVEPALRRSGRGASLQAPVAPRSMAHRRSGADPGAGPPQPDRRSAVARRDDGPKHPGTG